MRHEFNIQPETFEYEAVPSEFGAWQAEAPGRRRNPGYIAWVQSSLNQILGSRLKVDGISGPQTRSVIRAFQRQRGLTADGIVGPRTEAALRSAGAPALPWEPRSTMPENEVSQLQSEIGRMALRLAGPRPGCVGLSGVKLRTGFVEIWMDSCMVGEIAGGTAAVGGICTALRVVPCLVVVGFAAAYAGIITAVNSWGGNKGVKIFVTISPPPFFTIVPFAIFPQ